MTANRAANQPPASVAPITGQTVRAYRSLLGVTQKELAERLGVSQGAVAQVESGLLALSPSLAATLHKQLRGGGGVVSFAAFVGQFSDERRRNLPLVGHPQGTFTTLVVWKWTEQFHLAGDPATLQADGVVTVRLTSGVRAIAVRMPEAVSGGGAGGKVDDGWHEGEVFVFAMLPLGELRAGDLCLVQRASASSPHMLMTRCGGGSEGPNSAKARDDDPRTLMPLWPSKGRPFACDGEDVEAVLPAVYRARELLPIAGLDTRS